jgi:hypothetical protein
MKNIKRSIQPDSKTPLPIGFFTEDLRLVSRTTLWRWMGQGLKSFRIGGRVFISQADLQRFFDERSGGLDQNDPPQELR